MVVFQNFGFLCFVPSAVFAWMVAWLAGRFLSDSVDLFK